MASEVESDRAAAPERLPEVSGPEATPAPFGGGLGGLSAFAAGGALDASAVVALQRSAGNAAVSRMVAARAAAAGAVTPRSNDDKVAVVTLLDPPRPSDNAMLLRYQAGSSGHGGIEQRALSGTFSGTEVKAIYAGNWLRDLSQLPKHPAVTLLIRILSQGEFGRDTSADELGSYVPSEHMDNPEGGGTVEDPAVRADKTKMDEALAKLSPAQRAAYDREEAHRTEIEAAAKANNLPAYIETGKFHAKEKLAEAVTLGRTGEGMRAMGDALHGVEDYYSHSNFTEAGITMMASDPAMKPLVDRMKESHLGMNPALLTPVDPATGQVVIQSGTYKSGANDWVSRIELIQSEVDNGELREAFAVGWMKMAGITGEEIGRRLGEKAGGDVGAGVGATVGAVGGGIGGAVSGAASGFSRGRGFWDTVGSTVWGAGSGAVTGAEAGAEAGADVGGDIGAAGGGVVGGFVGKSLAEIVAQVGLDVIMTVISIPFAAITAAAKAGILEKIAEIETNASGGEARAAGLSGPTHSELSKDAPDSKLFDASTALAAAADEEIGRVMADEWARLAGLGLVPGASASGATGGSAAGAGAAAGGVGGSAAGAGAVAAPVAPPPAPSGGGTATMVGPPQVGNMPADTASSDPEIAASQKTVTDLVDKYVCHPSAQSWWRPILQGEASRMGGGP